MDTGSMWKERTVQQLMRYEALFKLLEAIQSLEDIAEISDLVTRKWKYFASVAGWRMVAFMENGFLVIDGANGETHISEASILSAWDAYHHTLARPCGGHAGEMPPDHPLPPEHLADERIVDLRVFPFVRAERWIALLSVAASHEPFSELDLKFNKIFGTHFADRVSDILLRRQATDAVIRRATRDALTGLYNRGEIIDHFEKTLALSMRTGQQASIVLADIDFFKVINEQFGHLAGDEVLREVSRRMTAELRQCDSLGRYGGEEFLFVLYPCDMDGLAKMAERIRRAVMAAPVVTGSDPDQKISVSISLGTSSTFGQENTTIDELLKQADDALSRSKANGRNRVTTGTPINKFRSLYQILA